MKYSKRYVAFTLIMVMALLLKFNTFGEDYSKIGDFRGGELESDHWSPLVAADVNDSLLTALIDNKTYTNEKYPIYMADDRSIMVPVDMLRDALNCSAHLYSPTELVVEKRNLSVTLRPVEKDGVYYVDVKDLSLLMEYNYSFDISNKTIIATDSSDSTSVVPARYDLREKQRVSTIRNQGNYGTCWAFAATSALESTLLPEQKTMFSVDHMTMSNSFLANQYDGGEYTMGMAYLAAWQGPVYEEQDPYGDGETNSELEAVRHVQEMQIIEGKNYEAIKTAVLKYGGVQTSLYSTLTSAAGGSGYYNPEHSAYCYIGTEKPNHDVVIIGWDDNYSKNNFSVELEGDGAFICQNSWGDGFGENGVFYVSYYDSNIGTHNIVYTSIDDADNYDKIYQSDLCGWVGQMGYNQESIFGANVFTAEEDEWIRAAGFYVTGPQTKYRVYIVNRFENESSFDHMVEVAQGTIGQAGYYTIDFDNPVEVSSGERYAVVVYLETPGAIRPLAVEFDSGDYRLSTVDLDDGEGYISYNGAKFVDVKTKKDCNICIKAYTDRK